MLWIDDISDVLYIERLTIVIKQNRRGERHRIGGNWEVNDFINLKAYLENFYGIDRFTSILVVWVNWLPSL